MIIRKAKIDDIPALSALACHVYAATFGPEGMFPEEMSFSEDGLAEQLAEHKSERAFHHAMSVNGDDFLVAVADNGDLVAYIGLRDARIDVMEGGRSPTDKDQATNGIYVHPDYHRQGLGTRLFDAAMQQPRFQRAENIYMVVWEENKPSYNFFIRHGFQPVGKKEVFSNGKVIGYDLVMMRTVL